MQTGPVCCNGQVVTAVMEEELARWRLAQSTAPRALQSMNVQLTAAAVASSLA